MTHRFSITHKEGLYDLLWEKGLAGLAILNRDGTFQKANPAFCKIVEYNELELQAKKFRDITLPSDVSVNLEVVEDVFAGADSQDVFKGYITKTNKVVYAHLRVIPFKQDGEVYYLVGQVYPLPPDQSAVRAIGQVSRPDSSLDINKINWKKVATVLSTGAAILGAFFVGIGYMINIIG